MDKKHCDSCDAVIVFPSYPIRFACGVKLTRYTDPDARVDVVVRCSFHGALSQPVELCDWCAERLARQAWGSPPDVAAVDPVVENTESSTRDTSSSESVATAATVRAGSDQ